jgi:hypothetical protein
MGARSTERETVRLLVIPCFILLLMGCGPKGSATYEVTGTVTYEGQPLERGAIELVPDNTKQRAVEARIAGGKYTIRAPEGEATVRIYATRVSGPFNKEMGAAPETQYLHDNYNARSKLRVKVSGSGENIHDFKLTKSGT